MISKRDVLSQAIDDCMKELYSLAQPSVTWEDFMEQNEVYVSKEREWKDLPEEGKPSYKDYMCPKPFEFYYLPREVLKNIIDSYVEAYGFNHQKELVDIKDTLIGYCEDPIIEVYKKDRGYNRREYEHQEHIVKQLSSICNDEELAGKVWDKVKEILNQATDFFNWNSYLNTFYTHTYLGASPNSNKEAVIENWKKYRNTDIEIDESKYKEEDDDYDE